MKVSLSEFLRSLDEVKLKPSTMLLGLGGILLVSYVVIGASYLTERREQPGLTEQIETGSDMLSSVSDSQQTLKELQDHLALLQWTLGSLEGAFPEELDSAALVESLLGYAAESGVNVREMSALPPSEAESGDGEGGAGYTVLGYTLAVEGGLPELLTFLSLIEGGATQTAAVGDIDLAEVGGVNEMTLSVSFYARPESGETTSAEGTEGAGEPTPEAPDTSQQTSTGG